MAGLKVKVRRRGKKFAFNGEHLNRTGHEEESLTYYMASRIKLPAKDMRNEDGFDYCLFT